MTKEIKNMNISKVTEVIVEDSEGKFICRIKLGAASLSKMTTGEQILKLTQKRN